jgi:hypothetical protein
MIITNITKIVEFAKSCLPSKLNKRHEKGESVDVEAPERPGTQSMPSTPIVVWKRTERGRCRGQSLARLAAYRYLLVIPLTRTAPLSNPVSSPHPVPPPHLLILL